MCASARDVELLREHAGGAAARAPRGRGRARTITARRSTVVAAKSTRVTRVVKAIVEPRAHEQGP